MMCYIQHTFVRSFITCGKAALNEWQHQPKTKSAEIISALDEFAGGWQILLQFQFRLARHTGLQSPVRIIQAHFHGEHDVGAIFFVLRVA
jgi:hypothetical protein